MSLYQHFFFGLKVEIRTSSKSTFFISLSPSLNHIIFIIFFSLCPPRSVHLHLHFYFTCSSFSSSSSLSLVPKTYRGVLSYLPVEYPDSSDTQKEHDSGYEITCDLVVQPYSNAQVNRGDEPNDLSPLPGTPDTPCTNQSSSSQASDSSLKGSSSDYQSLDDTVNDVCNNRYLQSDTEIPRMDQKVPSSWVRIEEDFIMIHTASQTHLSTTVRFAPESKLADGIIWLVYLTSKVSKKNLLQFLASLEHSGHIDLPFVNIVPVRAFRLEPLDGSGTLSIDGEAMKVTPFQAEILPSMGRIFTKTTY